MTDGSRTERFSRVRQFELFDLFIVRVAGVPFSELSRVATPGTFAAVSRFPVLEADLAATAQRTLDALGTEKGGGSKDRSRVKKAISRLAAVDEARIPAGMDVSGYLAAFKALEQARAEAEQMLAAELAAGEKSLHAFARDVLRRYLVFASRTMGATVTAEGVRPPQNETERKQLYRSLLLYMQRVCAKNDTLSEFGPVGWGRVDPDATGIAFAPEPGIARREVYVEQWVINALLQSISADPAAR